MRLFLLLIPAFLEFYLVSCYTTISTLSEMSSEKNYNSVVQNTDFEFFKLVADSAYLSLSYIIFEVTI